MFSSTSSTCLHTTSRHHIDAVSPGPETLTACATSALTGDVWDGQLLLLDLTAGAPAAPAAAVATSAGVSNVAWVSADTLATGDDGGDVTLWQRAAAFDGRGFSLTPVTTFGEHSQPITAVAPCLAAPTRLASTSLDGTAMVWTAGVAGGPTASLEHLPAHSWCDVQVHSAAWLGTSAESVATGASDGVVRLWDLRAARPAASRFAPHSAAVLSLLPGAAESQLLAGAESGELLLLDTRKLGASVASAAVPATSSAASVGSGRARPGYALTSLCALRTPAAPLVAAGTEDGLLAAIDPRDLKVLSTVAAHEGNAAAVARLPAAAGGTESGLTLLSGGWDKRLLRHDLVPAA